MSGSTGTGSRRSGAEPDRRDARRRVRRVRRGGPGPRARDRRDGHVGEPHDVGSGAARRERVERVRTLLRKAELMGCRCVVSLVGSGHPSDAMLAPDGAMLTAEGRSAFREVALRIVDGLDLDRTCYAIEPWRTSFFYRPRTSGRSSTRSATRAAATPPRPREHGGPPRRYDDTGGLAERGRAALGPDRGRPPEGPALGPRPHADRVGRGARRGRGDGPRRLPGRALGARPDLPCFCEHLSSEAEFAEN